MINYIELPSGTKIQDEWGSWIPINTRPGFIAANFRGNTYYYDGVNIFLEDKPFDSVCKKGSIGLIKLGNIKNEN